MSIHLNPCIIIVILAFFFVGDLTMFKTYSICLVRKDVKGCTSKFFFFLQMMFVTEDIDNVVVFFSPST